MEPVVTELCAERRRTIDERFARDLKDIDDCKARLKKIEELTIQMAELVKTSQEANQKALDDHNDRLRRLNTARPCGGISCCRLGSPQVWRR